MMERRNFLKISAASGAVAALEGCGNPDHQLIRFVPEENLIPGIATWKPSICTQCPAGCGLIVRVMEGEAEVVRHGQRGLMKMGLAKKLEGNPGHPINRGRLCPRGQAGLQVTYHPDRIKNPLARSGARGAGEFREISWDEAINQLVSRLSSLQLGSGSGSQLAFVTSRLRGQRASIVSNFLAASKGAAWIQRSFFDDEVIRQANAASFGHAQPPTIDLAQSNYVISLGADFLGAWNSPVAQSIGYGEMRKGRPGQRGRFVQFEPRLSLTASSADEWIPSAPGAEGLIALSLAQVMLREKLRDARNAATAGALIPGWSTGLSDFAPEKIEKQAGLPATTLVRIAREAAARTPAVAILGDAPAAQTNGYFNAIAVNALNSLLGNVGKPGGVLFTAELASKPGEPVAPSALNAFVRQITSKPDDTRVLLVYNANPVFAVPQAQNVRQALEKIPFIASFGSFLDETSVLADLILPDHSPLESWLDDVPPAGSAQAVASIAAPAMKPLHNTRAMPDVLLALAHRLGGDFAKALPWNTYEESLKQSFAGLAKLPGSVTSSDPDAFWQQVQEKGGWWSNETGALVSSPNPRLAGSAQAPPAATTTAPEFDGKADDFPFHFLPFASQMLYDGSLASLPWLQEAPDPLSTVMWGSWIEINPQVAGKLGLKQGDLIEVTSQHGSLRAPALLTPGIAPDVVAMPVGQGHENFTRYATGRGANPIAILAPLTVSGIDTLAWAATRVKIARVGTGKLAVFAGSLTDAPAELERR